MFHKIKEKKKVKHCMAVKWKALITALLTSLALTSPVAFAFQNYSLLYSGVKVFYPTRYFTVRLLTSKNDK